MSECVINGMQSFSVIKVICGNLKTIFKMNIVKMNIVKMNTTVFKMTTLLYSK
jgi:hypothetical protein